MNTLENKLSELIERADQLIGVLQNTQPKALSAPDWTQAHAWTFRKNSDGGAHLHPVQKPTSLCLADLKEIDDQKNKIVRNTMQFVSGKPANNVLLTGARGTGKSSLVKACLNEFASIGLRLIEIDKSDMAALPEIAELVQNRPERFVIFCDDLSFEEGETGYKALKSLLDGSISTSAENLLVYATSNRRHLLPEYMKENLSASTSASGEIHPGEVIEEKISLSERFGLWISFYPFSQEDYLAICAQWLSSFGFSKAAIDEARPQALVWALERGSRSGRVAFQFAKDVAGRA